MSRGVLWLSMGIGSTVGGLVPSLFGQGAFSPVSLACSVLGAVAGVWAAARLDASL